MKISNQITIVIALVLIFIANAAAQKTGDKAFAKMPPPHAAALKTWLAAKPNLRLATEADCGNKEGLKLQRIENESYQPYYFAGDFNADRKTDFAVALVDAKKPKNKRFAILIFNGSKTGFQAAYFDAGFDLSDSGLFFFGEKPERLAVGEFQTDNCGFFRWKNGKYVAEDCSIIEDGGWV